MNQWLNPLKGGTGSNLVDVGRATVRADLNERGQRLRSRLFTSVGRPSPHACGSSDGEAVAAELGTDPVDRHTVNVGTRAPRGVWGSCRGERTRPPARRSGPVEAEGSLIRGTPGRVGAALTTPGRVSTVRWLRVRQARQDGATRVNQRMNAPQDVRQLESDGSGLVSSAQPRGCRGVNSSAGLVRWPGGHGECLRRSRGDAAGAKLGASPVKRSTDERGNRSDGPLVSACEGGPHGEGPLPADAVGVGRRARSSPSAGKLRAWRRGPTNPLPQPGMPGAAGEHRRTAVVRRVTGDPGRAATGRPARGGVCDGFVESPVR